MRIHLEKHYQMMPKKYIIPNKNGTTSPYVKNNNVKKMVYYG